MPATLQVDVYVAPAIPIANGHPDPSKRLFSPISCTLIQGPTSAVLIDTPATIDLAQDLAKWVKETAPGKTLRFIYTTHAHGDHFLGNPVLVQHFPEAQCVATSTVVNDIEKQWPESLAMWGKMFPNGQIADGQVIPKPLNADGEFVIDGYAFRGIDVTHSDTEASSFLYVPALKLVVCGDIVYGDCYQFFGEASTQEKRKQWLDALDQIAALKPDIVVPGHKRESQANGPYLIEATKEYILTFEEELSKAENAEALEKAIVSRYPQRMNRFLLEWSCKGSFEEYSRAKGIGR
ncbi:metallo-beta-lactamase domain-containing protein [Aspergillus bombycis]|uniref:Metallo-beta-lactamase domain-containing protein n=1 Tax=Aspergillus bombycis TaxID=109264 RepID=A0A1F8A381_9EURO|nr:metallo-beta-lactamase domain-containing protein [Aspergillus bombycis]OGM46174.1 metallo-beta-lactamase domain-containing protein [Aspergillus bombycis]